MASDGRSRGMGSKMNTHEDFLFSLTSLCCMVLILGFASTCILFLVNFCFCERHGERSAVFSNFW